MTPRISRRQTLLGMLAAPLALAGCGGGASANEPPAIAYGETPCARCGMIIFEPRHAAGLVAGDEISTFDDTGEMIATVQERGASSGRVWVHDFANAAWIDGGAAFYGASPHATTPMGTGVVAFADRTKAVAYAAANGGATMTFQEMQTNWAMPARAT
jgi:nitrous oxide reductase accessory protein NosL